MATVVNNPATTNDTNIFGIMLSVLLVALFIFLLFYYGLPALGGGATRTGQGTGQGGGANITVPENIDVNINPQQ